MNTQNVPKLIEARFQIFLHKLSADTDTFDQDALKAAFLAGTNLGVDMATEILTERKQAE